MTGTPGKWIRRMGLALLPLGILTAGLVVLRLVLMVAGALPASPLDLGWLVVYSLMAVFFIRSGREYRRKVDRG